MNNPELLFDRAKRLRDMDQTMLRLLVNAGRGVPGAAEEYQDLIHDIGQNNPQDLLTMAQHCEANIKKFGQLVDLIHEGKELSDVDKAFYIQIMGWTGQLDDIH